MAQQDAVNAVGKQLQALELRKAGVTYDAIAKALGYRHPSGAHRAVKSALKKTLQEPADELRRLELERLDALMLALWPNRSDPYTADRILHVMKRRAELLGLDAKDRSDDNWRREVIRLLRDGIVMPKDVIDEFGHDLATELFISAGIPVDAGRPPEG